MPPAAAGAPATTASRLAIPSSRPSVPPLPKFSAAELRELEETGRNVRTLSCQQSLALSYMRAKLADEVYHRRVEPPSIEFAGDIRMLRFLVAHGYKVDLAWSEYLASLQFRKQKGMDEVCTRPSAC